MTLSSLLTSALAELADVPRLLVASDFDGVLAPLVQDPYSSRALPGTIEALEALAALPGTHAAVVSGRDLETLTSLTALAGSSVVRIGSHGAQSSADAAEAGDGGPSGLREDEAALLAQVTGELETLSEEHPGSSVERKPAAAVLHTRRMADADSARAAEAAALEVGTRHTGVHVLHGKHVVELSVVDADKGTALVALRDAVGATSVAYFGDDVTDEHAFERLGDSDVTVKVGPGHTAAQYRVDSPEDVAAALALLLERRSRR
jgi:trehalose 6-phosphate phosphatase